MSKNYEVIVVYGSKDFPPWLNEKEDLAEEVRECVESNYASRSALLIRVGESIEVYFDGGEPEDNTFGRDWSWVETELQRAYEAGLAEGCRNISRKDQE